MPHDLYEWLLRIKAVEREHSATRLATDRLLEVVRHDPAILGETLRPRDIESASEHLDGTYIIRLFAEFETGLRSFWSSAKGTDPPSRTRDLLDGIAATRRIPNDYLGNAHSVRDYRNALVHEREGEVVSLPIPEARSHLCTFFARLPPSW